MNKSRKKIINITIFCLVLLLFVFAVFPLSVKAVVLEEPIVQKYCIQISNTQSFPDYTFLLTVHRPWPKESFNIFRIIDDDCVPINNTRDIYHVHGTLYAIKNDDYKRIGSNFIESDFETADWKNKALGWGGSSKYNTPLISSDLEIGAIVSEPDKAYNQIISVAEIISVNDDNLALGYKNIHIGKDGDKEEVFRDDNQSSDIPMYSSKGGANVLIRVLLFMLIVGVIVFILIVKKIFVKKKRGNV